MSGLRNAQYAMIVKAPKPMSAEPEASPSSPSVTFTAFVVAQMIMPAQMTQTAVGTSRPTDPRVTLIVSEMPVATTSHQAMRMLATIVR